MTRGREQAQPEEWGVWEFGGPKTSSLTPTEIKKGIARTEIGLRNSLQTVETDVSYAANKIRDRIGKSARDLAGLGAFPLHEVVLDGVKTEMAMIHSNMIGRFVDTSGTIRGYTRGTGEHEGIPVVNSDQEEPIQDIEIITTRGIWMQALQNTLSTFKQRQNPEA